MPIFNLAYRLLNKNAINNLNTREYFTQHICTGYCIVGHCPPLSLIIYELLLILSLLQNPYPLH